MPTERQNPEHLVRCELIESRWYLPGRKGGDLSPYSILRCTGILSGKSPCRMLRVASRLSQMLLGLACLPLLQGLQATVRFPGLLPSAASICSSVPDQPSTGARQ